MKEGQCQLGLITVNRILEYEIDNTALVQSINTNKEKFINSVDFSQSMVQAVSGCKEFAIVNFLQLETVVALVEYTIEEYIDNRENHLRILHEMLNSVFFEILDSNTVELFQRTVKRKYTQFKSITEFCLHVFDRIKDNAYLRARYIIRTI